MSSFPDEKLSLTSPTLTAPAKRSMSNAQQVLSTFRQPGDNGNKKG
ncbi:hypothetical protein IG609_008870 [Pectobacterium quasiaquaticum]|uniref:Uncharacterized protein n=1 Tax=Pectobacterium quasiaquaticum TaxID=2774015 RepID=A0A9Q8TTW4_9GAMM|nr:hypothetical protein IG609_008870 [Pectobacterium quasiaquaticum]